MRHITAIAQPYAQCTFTTLYTYFRPTFDLTAYQFNDFMGCSGMNGLAIKSVTKYLVGGVFTAFPQQRSLAPTLGVGMAWQVIGVPGVKPSMNDCEPGIQTTTLYYTKVKVKGVP